MLGAASPGTIPSLPVRVPLGAIPSTGAEWTFLFFVWVALCGARLVSSLVLVTSLHTTATWSFSSGPPFLCTRVVPLRRFVATPHPFSSGTPTVSLTTPPYTPWPNAEGGIYNGSLQELRDYFKWITPAATPARRCPWSIVRSLPRFSRVSPVIS